MSVFRSLSREHELLVRLVSRLERSVAGADERAAAREARNVLLVLLQALEAHERLEDMVFDRPLPSGSDEARSVLHLVERQHEAVSDVRREALSLLRDGPRDDLAMLRGLVLRLTGLLRHHFDVEERELWPRFNAVADRSTLRRLDVKARDQVREMERDIDHYWAAITDYLTGDR